MSRFPVAFRPPAFASRPSDTRRGVGLSSRSAYRLKAGPRRGYRVPHARAATGVGAPYTPRTAVLIPVWGTCPAGACRSTAASPSTRSNIPSCGAPLYEASTRVHAIHPSGLPLACGRPDGTGRRLGFPLRLPHPADQEPTTHARGGDRPSSTDLEQRSTTSAEPPILRVHSIACDLASHRPRGKSSRWPLRHASREAGRERDRRESSRRALVHVARAVGTPRVAARLPGSCGRLRGVNVTGRCSGARGARGRRGRLGCCGAGRGAAIGSGRARLRCPGCHRGVSPRAPVDRCGAAGPAAGCRLRSYVTAAMS